MTFFIALLLLIAVVVSLTIVALAVLFVISRPYRRTNWGKAWLNWLDGLNRWFCVVYHRLEYDTIALPANGAAIVASNHVSGLDPLLLIAASPRPLRFLIAREQYERFGLRWLFRAVGCIPVDRESRPERALREALRVLASGGVVALFPHGGIHLDSAPSRPLKSGAARLAHISDSAIYPVRLQGIAGEGKVVSAVSLRGYPKLRVSAVLRNPHSNDHHCMEQLAAVLEGRDLDYSAHVLSQQGA